MSETPVGIVGFSGYSGAELISLLSRHPHVEPVLLEHREGGDRSRPLGHDGPRRLPCTADSVRSAGLTAVFFATPPEVSMDLAGPMLHAGAKIIDLSGAFRLGTAENYTALVQRATTPSPICSKRQSTALPEFCREPRGRRAPDLKSRLLPHGSQSRDQTLDRSRRDRRASSASSATRRAASAARAAKPSLKTSFCEVTENFSAYSILDHRHVPEVLCTSGLEESRVQLHRAAHSYPSRDSRNHLLPGRGIHRFSGGFAGNLSRAAMRRSRLSGFIRPVRFPTCKPSPIPTSAISASNTTSKRAVP